MSSCDDDDELEPRAFLLLNFFPLPRFIFRAIKSNNAIAIFQVTEILID